MLDKAHLGNQVGGFDERGLGIATGNDDVEAGAPAGERGEHDVEVEIIVTQGNVELVENDETERVIIH